VSLNNLVLVGLPSRKSDLSISNWPLVRFTCETEPANFIVSPEAAVLNADRNVPGPLSALLLTT
jgi:hypothetical protein